MRGRQGVLPEVWPKFRQPSSPPPATTGRQVVHGRSVYSDPGRAALPLARCGSVWRFTRHPRSGTAGIPTPPSVSFSRLLKCLQYVPRVIVTDKLRSYGVAQRQLLPEVEHRQSRYLNNRAENSHRPTRRRERQMQRFIVSRTCLTTRCCARDEGRPFEAGL